MNPVHEDISDIHSDDADERFSSPLEARKKAMDFLARREYGRNELIRKLADKGYVRNIVEQAVNQLTLDGLQCDERFAGSFVQSRISQGKGPVRIRLDLSQRGVEDATIECAIDESAADWHGLAREVRERKFGFDSPADFKEKARQMRFLQYRGFERDHIQSAF